MSSISSSNPVVATVDLPSDSVAISTRRRVMSRLMPYLFLLYVIAYLDRVNLSYAALQIKGDLRFSDAVLGFGAGIFFIGYILLEIPGGILVEKWSARGWMARIMISWGIVAMLMGAVHTKNQFYVMRFLLGVAEAGFFPGMIVYLSHWFRYEDRAKAVALFMSGQPLSNMLGSPLSGLLLGVNWFGLAGWRWLFIIEGAPAVIFGFVTIFYLTDRPHQARWLSQQERDWLTSELMREKQAKDAIHSYGILEALRDRGVIVLALAYFCIVTAVYGFTFWLPTIIKRQSGLSNLHVSLISAIPYCVGLVTILIAGWSSDRTKERRWHTALPMIAASVGLLLAVLSQDKLSLAVAMFCLAAVGIYGYLPGFWALPTSFLTGTAAAASIGLINLIGNLGGFAGPYAVGYLSNVTNSFFGGIAYLSLSALMGAVLILSLKKHYAIASH
ncbi:MAG TPA: MFS transporter [Pyrinomonadaceae bacterium]|nr:MFS transporter [Pyrinomonadaceae bacterium]